MSFLDAKVLNKQTSPAIPTTDQTTDQTTGNAHLITNSIMSAFDCSGLAAVTQSGVYTLLSDGASHPLPAKDVYCEVDASAHM